MHVQAHDTFDAVALERHAGSPQQARVALPAGDDDAPIRFLALDDDAPLAYRPYRLHIGERLLLGRTDAEGWSGMLSAADRAALSDWEID